jgi:sigma-B regulation protein RsbU (phosphoserine phosphatase)
MAPKKPPTLQYVCLAILFVLACAYQGRAMLYYFPEMFHHQAVGWPFNPAYNAGEPHATSAQPNALNAGIKENDILVAINGRPFTGTAVYGEAIAQAAAGETMQVTVRTPGDATPRHVNLTIRPHRLDLSSAVTVTAVMLKIVLPVFCILLAFWVVAVRPRDPSAWLLVPVLLFLSTIYGAGIESWGPGIRDLATIYRVALNSGWPLSMFLFGLYFPERAPVREDPRWWHWTVAIFIPTLIVVALLTTIEQVGEVENFAAVARLYAFLERMNPLIFLLTFAGVGSFFASMKIKSGLAASRDVKRRFNLVYAGATVALTPLFILSVVQSIKNRPLEQIFPGWLVLGSLLLLMFFPATLAYAIVVQRAMDVRVVIRQGLQYALARHGVLVLQIILTSIIVTAAVTLESGAQRSRPQKIVIISLSFIAILWLRKLSGSVRAWVDRRFFRDAYNAEQILTGLSDEVRSIVETKPLLERVAQRIAESLHVPRVAVLLEDGGWYRPAYAMGYASAPEGGLPDSAATIQRLRRDSDPERIYLDDQDSWINSSSISDDERRTLVELHPQLLLPLSMKEKLLGLIALGEKRSEEPYSGTDLRLLKSVATQTGLALANAQLTSAISAEVGRREKMNREIEIAREVQERLFPQKLPPVAGVDYCGRCRTALGVGGDYYDFLALPGGMLGVALGDISGKGIPAALMMASLQASLRAESMRAGNELAALMSRVNQALYEASSADRYATFFYAQFDPASRRLTYVNGGHCAPMLFRAGAADGAAGGAGTAGVERLGSKKIERLDEGGPVIGLIPDCAYQQAELTLAPGDRLVIFTDGVSEAMNPALEEWGEDRLIATVQAAQGCDASETITHIMQAADQFAAGAPQHDDMTLIVLRFL